MIIEVSICCRDEHGYMINGADRFDFHTVENGVSDLLLSLESRFYPPKLVKVGYFGARGHRAPMAGRHDEDVRWAKVGRVWLKLAASPTSGGNIFWDSIFTTPFYAVELINYIRSRRCPKGTCDWDCTEGISELFAWWRNGTEPLTELRLAELSDAE